MRIIKFRAWDKKEREMINWEWFSQTDEHTLGCMNDLLNPDLILMQFTGLKDKTGKEIYEGDIVKGEKRFVGVVVYDAPSFYFRINELEFVQVVPELHDSILRTTEVIGNIYENPKLLKKI